MLGQDADEALVRAEDRAVDGHRPLGLPVGVDVLELEALGQHREVDLDGGDLPGAPQHVLDVDVDLGPVEGAVARIQLVVEGVGGQRLVAAPPRPASHCSWRARATSRGAWRA